MAITKGLIIAEPWIGLILSGEKTWEMRAQATSYRGWFGLIPKGSGAVDGIARLADVGARLTHNEMLENKARHRIPGAMIRSGEVAKWSVPWILADVFRLPAPVPYRHRSGAVTWVELDAEAQAALSDAMMAMDLPALLASAQSSSVQPIQPVRTVRPARRDREAGSFLARAAASRRPAGAASEDADETGVIGSTTLTAGNIRNAHFYLTPFLSAFPKEVIGGPNAGSRAARTVAIDWGGATPAVTDIDGTKRIFRSRGWIRSFFERTGARSGDTVVVEQAGAASYRVRLERGPA
jgi:hypothetical protein